MASQQITVTVHYEDNAAEPDAIDGDGNKLRLTHVEVGDLTMGTGPLLQNGRGIPRALRRALVEAALAAAEEQ